MTGTPFLDLLSLLCGLASATFAAGVRSRLGIVGMVAAFALGVRTPATQIPDPRWLGTAAGILALGILFRPRFLEQSLGAMQPLAAGALAGVLGAIIQAQGVPRLVAIPATAAIPGVALWLALRRPSFASASILEEGLVVIGILGLLTGAAPGVAAGWNSAGGMNLVDNKTMPPAIPTWVWALVGGAAGTGGLYTLWRRS